MLSVIEYCVNLKPYPFMGFNIKTSELLILSKQAGIDYGKAVTIGRQQLIGSRILFQKLFKRYSLPVTEYEAIVDTQGRYAERFLKLLGAEVTDSIDASDYEKATIIHDMNLAIPESLHGQYSVVIDSGSLEHVFNYPVAIKNCMELVQEGGHFIGISPANNFLGHGFYQFSPELFYRVFSPENGFKPVKMVLFFNDHRSPVYEVMDPLQVRERVRLRNTRETYLFFVARREAVKPVLVAAPQQSDYVHISWTNSKEAKTSVLKSGLAGKVKAILPDFVTVAFLVLRKKYLHGRSLFSPVGDGKKKFFRKVKRLDKLF